MPLNKVESFKDSRMNQRILTPKKKKKKHNKTFQCTELINQAKHGTNQESQHHLNQGHNIVQHLTYGKINIIGYVN